MLALKYSHQLSWGELRFIEDPMHAIRTVESEHGRRIGGKNIQNAHLHDLPNGDDRRFDPYRFLKTKLENGEVFLVNHSTMVPAITSLEIDADGNPKYTFRNSTSQYFHSAFRSALWHIPIPKPMGVLRDEPKPEQAKQEQEKIEREKHIILLNLEGQNDRPLPLKHNITLYVENTSQGGVAVRQLSNVIYNPYSKVFSTEKGDGLKVYAVPDSLVEVRKDLNTNKNLADSESKGLIKALTETGQETRADGAILHHFDYIVPVPLSLKVESVYSNTRESSPSDVYILKHEDSDWVQTIYIAKHKKQVLSEGSFNTTIEFTGLPEKGKFTLIKQNQNRQASPVTLFSDLEYKDIVEPKSIEEWPVGAELKSDDDQKSSGEWDEWLESNWA